MLATMVDQPEATSRKDFLATPTGELAGVVDDILDRREASAAIKAPARSGKSLLAVLRRLFEPGAPSSN
ncbi:MAG: hypothetical protein FJZ01_10915 [Candidatus Sericytochromatia bacterium]|nr:hypothetical protein [Candidatus Tanganyikabacteria bacterium]